VRPVEPYRVVRWVGGRVAERRRAYGLTQEQLAEKLEVSIKYLQRVEAGKENLTIASVVKLANALDTEPSYLLRQPRTPPRRRPGRPPAKRSTATSTKQR
jgi:transcriptional regulator with XRE-family HTH domain